MYGGNAFSHKCEEIIGPRYPQIIDLLTRCISVPDSIDPRPSFLDEYLAVTGNGEADWMITGMLFTVIREAWAGQSGIL